jgi:membrane protease YdiL (CAAX protease family)
VGITEHRERGLLGAVRTWPVHAYFVAAIALSWAYWIHVALAGGRLSHFPGLVGPAVAALGVSACCGRDARRDLVRRVMTWRVHPRWYLASLVPPVVAAIVIALRWLAGTGPTPGLFEVQGIAGLGWTAVIVVMVVVNGFGEEIGWRGFAWPQLRERRPIAQASLVLALGWVIWHLPLLWIDSGFGEMPVVVLPGLVMGLVCGSVVLGWLMERSGSVPVVAVWHVSVNLSSSTTATTVAAPFVSVVVILWAMWILRRSAPELAPT